MELAQLGNEIPAFNPEDLLKAYIVLNQNDKNIDMKNIFLQKPQAVKYLNQLNDNIYNLNLAYLKNKLNKTKKIKKQEKLKKIIEDYKKIREKAQPMIDAGFPLYLQPSFKIKYLKHKDYILTDVNLTKKD